MIQVQVLTMIFNDPEQPALLALEPCESPTDDVQRIVSLRIGYPEGMLLGAALEQVDTPRPLTHDLFIKALSSVDVHVDHALINDMVGETFFAKLFLRQGDRLIELDARPTDAITLAIRDNSPFYIDEDVFAKASYPFSLEEDADKEAALGGIRLLHRES